MNPARKLSKRRRYLLTLVSCLVCVAVLGMSLSVALAGPEGAQVINGQVSFQQSGNNTVVTASDKSVINYSSFDITALEVVEFVQPSSTAAVLNRILSANPTQIDGTLLANGRVFFVNRAGIMFGGGATVNVNQLVASSLDISNEDFIEGRYQFAGGSGAVANYGDISAESVYLIGKQVTNAGTISAPDGYVVMAAGDRVFLGQPGSNIVVEVDDIAPPQQSEPDVANEGTLNAPGGEIVLAAGDIYSRAITNTGELSAPGGQVTANAARITQAGTISVDSDQGNGGNINLTASEQATLTGTSLTTANAGAEGNGGQVIVDGGRMVVFDNGAKIEAKGGSVSGDGGFVEISGGHFVYAGQVDASATNGQAGTLLIDPEDLIIANGPLPDTPAQDTVYERQVEQFSADGLNIIYAADNSITVKDIQDNEITGGSGNIELIVAWDDPDSFVLFEDLDDAISTTTGDIFIAAGGGGIDIGNLMTGSPNPHVASGSIKLITYSGGDITTGYLNALGGSEAFVWVDSDGDLEISGTPQNGAVKANTNLVPRKVADETTADVCLKAAGDITVNYGIEAKAIAKDATTAHIRICAGEDLYLYPQNGWIEAWSQTPGEGTAESTIKIRAGETITVQSNKPYPIVARAHAGSNGASASSSGLEDDEDTDGTAHAEIDIEKDYDGECPDCVPRQEPPEPPFPPLAIDDAYTVEQDQTLLVLEGDGVLFNDIDGDPLTAILVSGPAHGTLQLNPDGTFTYIPDEGFTGTDTFTYKANNGLDSNIATVTIEVTPDDEEGGNGDDNGKRAVAPVPKPIVWQVAGCSELTNWLADELGVPADKVQVYVLHAYSQAQSAVQNSASISYKADIQWCRMCARLRNTASVLQDIDGTYLAAMAELVNEFVSTPTPPSEEQMALIASTLAEHKDDDTYYATAGQWLDAMAQYVGILTTEMGLTVEDATALVADKYLESVTEIGNDALTAYVEAHLYTVGG